MRLRFAVFCFSHTLPAQFDILSRVDPQPDNASDSVLVFGAWVGAGLALVVLCGFANAILMAALWALYLSFVHVGQLWYSYGWEIQLLETGFLAIFLCPLLDTRPFPRRPPPL